MEAGPPGAMAAISTKNHNGAARQEWQKRLEATKQRVRQVIVTMQREFAGVTDPSERHSLNGRQGEDQREGLSTTPAEIFNKLAKLELRETSEGYVDGRLPTPHYADLAAVNPQTGEAWNVRIEPSGSVTFRRVVKPEETPPDVESLQYAQGRNHFVSDNGNGQGSWKKEPATLKIVGKGQEFVYQAPVKDALPTASHPS